MVLAFGHLRGDLQPAVGIPQREGKRLHARKDPFIGHVGMSA
jgi:hypothetical protein